jgi:hypothetical protein
MKDERIKVEIRPGPGTPAQKRAWDSFWQRLLVKPGEGKNNGNNNEN